MYRWNSHRNILWTFPNPQQIQDLCNCQLSHVVLVGAYVPFTKIPFLLNLREFYPHGKFRLYGMCIFAPVYANSGV